MHSTILAYRSLDDSGSSISTAPVLFLEHMARLADAGVRVVPLERVQAEPGTVAITFEHGFRNFSEFGLPVLEHYRYPATVFVATGFAGDRNRWDRSRREIPKLPLLDWDELRALPRPLVQLGCGTVTYPDLVRAGKAKAAAEMDAANQALEHMTGVRPLAFSYPYGVGVAEMRAVVAERFQVACSDRLDYVTAEADPLALPRIDSAFLHDPRLVTETIAGQRRWQLGIHRVLREVHSLLRSAS